MTYSDQEQIIDSEEEIKKNGKSYRIGRILFLLTLIFFVTPIAVLVASLIAEKELPESLETIFGLFLFISMILNVIALIFMIVSWFKDEYSNWKNILLFILNLLYLIGSVLLIIEVARTT